MLLSDITDGSVAFIDTNIFVYHFSANSRFNRACTDFLERIENRAIRGLTSAAVVLEVTHRIMIEEALQFVSGIKLKGITKYLKSHPEIVKDLALHRTAPAKIALLGVEIIPMDMKSIEKSQDMKAEYGLLSSDAVVLQVMKEQGTQCLASNDTDFEAVDFIKVFKPG